MVALFAGQPFTSLLVMSNLPWFRYEWIMEKSKASGYLNAKRRAMNAHDTVLIFSPRAPLFIPQKREGKPYNKGLVKAQTHDDVYGRMNRVVVKDEEGIRYPRSVQYFTTPESEPYPTLHKCQKSQAALRFLLMTHSREGDLVLDNAMGSGATGVACLATGRRFVGIEKNGEIFARARQWLAFEEAKAALSELG